MQHHTPQPQGEQMGTRRTESMGRSGMNETSMQGTEMGMQGMMGMRLQDVETVQQRNAVEHVLRAIQVCEFCADQCIRKGDPHMSECIRMCRDVSELGTTALRLIPRGSRYAETTLQALTQAIQDCAQECGSHQDAHCQECAEVLPQAEQSIQQYLQFE